MCRKQIISVYVVHHPIESKKITITEVPFQNQSLADIKYQFTDGHEVIIVLDDNQIESEAWAKTQIPPGCRIALIPAVCDPFSMAALFLTPAVQAIFWAAVINIAIQVAIVAGLFYLGGMLFGPSMNQPIIQPLREEGQSFGWAPRTRQQEGIVHPMCYGTNMHYGNIVARWTDVDEGGSELLYMILDYGRGPVQGRGSDPVYFNDQSSGHFPDINIQERLGTLNQTVMTGFEKNKLEYRLGLGGLITYSGEPGSLTWTTPNNFFDDIEYTLEFPYGLRHHQDDGSQVSHGVGVKVEISIRDADSWTTILEATINGNQMAPLYKAYKVSDQSFDCDHGVQYDLKVSKTTEDKNAARYGDELRLRSVREIVDVEFTRPGKALLGITALATARLPGNLNVKWVADGKLVNIYNGSTWGVGFTHNRAWVTLDVLTQPVISGDGDANPWVIERYEGLDPSKIDLALFYEWAQWCDDQVTSGVGEETEDRMPCDIIVDWQTDVWSLAYELAQTGRMNLYWQGNILTGWIDKVTTDIIDLVTFNSIMARSWKSAWAGSGEMAGSVEVAYKDAQEGHERKTLPLSNENAGLYTRVVSIEGIGVTGRAFAVRVGNHALNRNRLITNINSVRMPKDALRYRLGQVVRLQATVPNWGATYRIVQSEANNTCELDRVISGVSPGNLVFVRTYDEGNEEVSVDSYTVASCAGKVLTIVETWNPTPIKNNILAVGADGKIKLRRIIKIHASVENHFDVLFETYNAALFDSDDADPHIVSPDYKWPSPPAALAEPVTKWEVIDIVKQLLPPAPDVDIPWRSNCDWNNNTPGAGYISWSKRNADEPILLRYRGTSYQITPASTNKEFIYWDPDTSSQFLATDVASIALAPGNWVMCRNKNGVAFPSVPMQLLHAALLQAGTITAEYAQIANLTVGTNQIIDNAVTQFGSSYTIAAKNCPDGVTTEIQKIATFESKGGIVVITVNYTWLGNAMHKMRIYRGPNVVAEIPLEDWYSNIPVGALFAEVPGEGIYDYTARIYVPPGEVDTEAANRALVIYELNK